MILVPLSSSEGLLVWMKCRSSSWAFEYWVPRWWPCFGRFSRCGHTGKTKSLGADIEMPSTTSSQLFLLPVTAMTRHLIKTRRGKCICAHTFRGFSPRKQLSCFQEMFRCHYGRVWNWGADPLLHWKDRKERDRRYSLQRHTTWKPPSQLGHTFPIPLPSRGLFQLWI